MSTGWLEQFPGLSQLDTPDKQFLSENSQLTTIPEGTQVFGPGKSPENMLFFIEGTVRVQQMSRNGQELVLYRIQAGQNCVLTTACLLSYNSYLAEGIAETPLMAATVPKQAFDTLVAQSKDFRNFVFAAFSKRMMELFMMIDQVAFQRVDVRLAQKLLELAEEQTVHATHQRLSTELGTAREVVSRQLQKFQRQGWIEQTRGKIHLHNLSALSQLSQQEETG